jgi:hypothetical protein
MPLWCLLGSPERASGSAELVPAPTYAPSDGIDPTCVESAGARVGRIGEVAVSTHGYSLTGPPTLAPGCGSFVVQRVPVSCKQSFPLRPTPDPHFFLKKKAGLASARSHLNQAPLTASPTYAGRIPAYAPFVRTSTTSATSPIGSASTPLGDIDAIDGLDEARSQQRDDNNIITSLFLHGIDGLDQSR